MKKNHLCHDSKSCITVHASTNNIANDNSCDYILSGLANLITTIHHLKPYIHIIVSSILPQPLDMLFET